MIPKENQKRVRRQNQQDYTVWRRLHGLEIADTV
jgi:hypothetical protein